MNFPRVKKTLKSLKDLPFPDKVQIGILIAIFLQAFLLFYQIYTLSNHFKIQQRPIVGVSNIESVVLGNKILQSEIEENDELLIKIIFKNIGESPAFVNYLKIKVFYGYFLKNNEKPCFHTHALYGSVLKKSSYPLGEEVPIESSEFFKNSVLNPNQTTEYITMDDAKKLMDRIRSYTTNREAPIFIECEVSYSDILKSDHYWYNCVYELQWPAAKHITIFSNLSISNADDHPIHLTYGQLLEKVAKRQKVKPVMDAIIKGAEDLSKIVNFDCVNQ
jgi:hypothetical protein